MATWERKPIGSISIEFSTAAAAMEYRKANGGWIFAFDDVDSMAVWFDASIFTPSLILRHPLVRDHSGRLF